MPQLTDLELYELASIIRNEVVKRANSTTRVGQLFQNIIDNKINKADIGDYVARINGNADAVIRSGWITPVEIMNMSGSGVFQNAHGTAQVGDKFFIGTTGAKLVSFNNPDDLSDFTVVDFTSINVAGIASMVYNADKNKLYATIRDNGHTPAFTFGILEINPDDITDYTLHPISGIDDCVYPAIVSDGDFIYGVAYYNTTVIFKIRISDWTLVTITTWIGATDGHAAQIHKYSDRTELYFTSAHDNKFIKADATTLAYTELDLSAHVNVTTDDFVFKFTNNSGGKCYIGGENTGSRMKGGVIIDTATMAVTAFDMMPTYGLFTDGDNLYNMGLEGFIEVWAGFDMASRRTYLVPGYKPNEFFYSSSGKLFFTAWNIADGLIEFRLRDNKIFGKNGTFVSQDNKTITVTNGIITGISDI